MEISKSDVPPVDKANRNCLNFEHPLFSNIMYKTYIKDCKLFHKFLTQREYTLEIADILYGFNVARCWHDNTMAWGEAEIQQLLKSFKVSTIAQS